jgi:hypothetical protein
MSTSLPDDKARGLVESLVRTGRDERHSVLSYPLLPIGAGRVVITPSLILFSNWTSALEQGLGRRRVANNRARDRRYHARVERALGAAGLRRIKHEVKIKSDGGTDLTDLDVVAVEDTLATVLVAQLKSFITPTNLMDFNKADQHVAHGLEQCAVADSHRDAVQRAIETTFHVRLVSDWTLRQIVVVEAVTGSSPPSAQYPVVTVEWLRRVSTPSVAGSVEALWLAARDLPEAATFRSSVVPSFEIFEPGHRALDLDERFAIFEYATSPE